MTLKLIKGDTTFMVGDVRAVKRHGATTFDLRLSDPEMKPQRKALKAAIKSDPEIGRRLMQEAGILTATGRLAKKFGG